MNITVLCHRASGEVSEPGLDTMLCLQAQLKG